jgi:low temperature requirement protein LtrA
LRNHSSVFIVASRDDPPLRRSVLGLAVGTAIGVGLLVAASAAEGPLQGAIWALALLLDMAPPSLIGSEGSKLVPGHFAASQAVAG